jgi:hypothetical protein
VVGEASGGGDRQLSVQEGCTRRHGARGGDGEFGGVRGGAMQWLNGCRNGGTMGVTGGGGRKDAPRWGGGWAPYIAARGGGRRAARRRNRGVGKWWWGSRGCGKAAAATV